MGHSLRKKRGSIVQAPPSASSEAGRPNPARSWRARLARELRSAGRLVVLGVGNEDRADDGAGSLCARLLERKLRHPSGSESASGAQNVSKKMQIDAKKMQKNTFEAGVAARSQLAPGGSAAPIVQVLDGGDAPENATGAIRRFRPTHVLIIDAAAGGREPGSIFFISRKKIPDEDISTHRIPLSRLVRYLEESIGCRVLVVGIEPRDTAWGKPPSPAARKAAAELAESLAVALGPAAAKPIKASSRRKTP
jgi:hydrogenase 3 maturation protease